MKQGSKESCNCHAKDEMHKDTHIVVGKGPGQPPNRGVVVEVTPAMKSLHPDWTTKLLKKRLLGKLATFTGPLLYDLEHLDKAFTTNSNGKKNWRWTCWELHPVTDIQLASTAGEGP